MPPFLPAAPLLHPLLAYLLGASLCALIMVATWLVQCKTKNAGIVDVVWAWTIVTPAITFVLGGITASNFLPLLLALTLLVLWAYRLSSHLHHRYDPAIEDARYAALRNEWGDQADRKMLSFYFAQAMGSLLLVLPIGVIAYAPHPNIALALIASAAILFSISLETLSDLQLRAFKAQPDSKGRLCDQGLWAWSRHPNYFFEWTIWVGFGIWGLLAGSFPISLLALIAPVMMYHFLVNVTGVKPTDEHLAKSRPEAFAAYAARVPAFFPRPPRK